ncbi:hypothetical protein CMO89_01400 [Candidatus Woesearchaeota archaeon]|nr:hypothetical protein [Candidatus Woesearchaeota archaeon]|tara:strand:+ start:103 stop:354 length:252 start_codon:yes stop_codon:yes gene_type:complete
MPHNIRKHEFIGLLLIFLAGTCLGIGLYLTIWGANRPIFYNSLDYLIKGKEMLIFPIFFGIGGILWVLGKIELKEAMPGRNLR